MCSVAASCRRGVGEPLARLDSMLPFVGLDGLGEFRAQRFAVLPSVSRRCIGKHILDGTAIVPTVRYEDINFVLLLRCHGEFLSLVDYCLIVSLYTKTNRMSSSNFVLSLMRALPAARQRARDGGTHNPSKSFGARLLVTSRQTAAVEAGVTGYAARRCEWGRRAARVEGRGRECIG